MSREVPTLSSSTFTITSPALMPAFSAGEFLVDGLHQHAVLDAEEIRELLLWSRATRR